MNKRDDEYSNYVDNEEICVLEGIPCRFGIPCCSKCLSPDKMKDRREYRPTWIKVSEEETVNIELELDSISSI